jgi:predicted permease
MCRDSNTTTLFMVGATMGEAGLPMILGFLLELFGPRSLPWTILLCAITQAVLYMAVHVLAAQGASHDEVGEDVGGDTGVHTDRYRKVSVGTEDESTPEEDGVEMTAL